GGFSISTFWPAPAAAAACPSSPRSFREIPGALAGDRRNLGDSESPVRPGTERLDGGRGTVPGVPCRGVVEADGHLERAGVRADHLRALPAGAEANAAVGPDLDLHVVEALRARDGVLRVGELEEAAVLHEARGRHTGAEDVGPVLRADLQDDVVGERVHPEPGAGEHGVQVEPGGGAHGAEATLLQGERAGLPGARRVLEVGEAVAVVVDAVAAYLGGRRLRREARVGVDARAADAGVRRTGVEVVAVGYRGAGGAAADGGVVAGAGIAGVGRAGVVIVAVEDRRAAAGDGGVV